MQITLIYFFKSSGPIRHNFFELLTQRCVSRILALIWLFNYLAVLQLCYNKFTGSIPIQLRYLRKLTVLALQYNQLTGAIPASLGDLMLLRRLDLSFNSLFGSIPAKVADMPVLEVLDIRNNTLSGRVPLGKHKICTIITFSIT